MTAGKTLPKDFPSLTPHLVIKGAKEAIEFYKKALGAQEVTCMLTPDNKVMHACLKIGNSNLMLAEEMRERGCNAPDSSGGSPVTIHVYVDDVDTAFDQAVKAGAKVIMPLNNMFWGDRYGQFMDPFGHRWSMATKVEELTHEEIQRRQKAFCAQMATAPK
jgi:uncharacterized glyoxalase superfamily protein PhnB